MKKRSTLVVAALVTGAALALAAPLAASAHVTIDPGQAIAGSYTVITIKVPNESATATTNRLEISLPEATPFSSVRYVPVAGWSTELVTTIFPSPVTVGDREITEAVTRVIWTAEPGSEIGAGQLQVFPLSVGPVPDTGSIVITAEQDYTDGTTVSWSETGEDAQHPAPVLYVNDAPAGDHHATDEAADSSAEITAGDSSVADSSTDVLARATGIGGLVLGIVAVVLAIRNRRSTAK